MPLDADLALAAWTATEELERQKTIALARDYYDGEHNVPLTDRQEEYLGFNDDSRFCVNYCATVVDAVGERLIVSGFGGDDALADLAWTWWAANKMDSHQVEFHADVITDGDGFIIVDWDKEKGQPRFTIHPPYVDPQAGGSGFGCKVFYPDNDHRRPPTKASKRWTETYIAEGGKEKTRRRMTVYFPDRVEKYALSTDSEAGWAPLKDAGEPWQVPWVDGRGNPLGIPVIPFLNKRRRSELWNAIPVQDAINKTVIDILAVADNAGFPVIIANGFFPTTDGKDPASDGSNYLKLFPGCWITTPKDGAGVDVLEGADVAPLLGLLDSLIMKLAQVTDTPVSRFQLTRQIAAEGTLKQQESPLLAKVRARQTSFGNSYEQMMKLAFRLAGMYGAGMAVDEEAAVETIWEPAETRDERDLIETLALKREKLAIPLTQIWVEAGYTQAQIDEMMTSPEYQARAAGLNAAMNGLQWQGEGGGDSRDLGEEDGEGEE